jgi:hypothetical protein
MSVLGRAWEKMPLEAFTEAPVMSIMLSRTPSSWYALLEGSSDDIAAFKGHFADSGFSFDERSP